MVMLKIYLPLLHHMIRLEEVGMFPVLYEGKTDEHVSKFENQNKGYEINFEHLHIGEWRELSYSLI